MTAPDLPAVRRHRRHRMPVRRLRALVPTLLAGLCWWADVPGAPALLAIGILGGAAIWREDAGSDVDGWMGRFPGVPFGLVERLPAEAERSAALEVVCDEVGAAQEALVDALKTCRGPQRRALTPIGRELAGLVALAGDLSWQLERLDRVPDASAPRIQRLESTLANVVPAVRQLRATLVRAAASGESAHHPRLGALLTLERDLTARQDCRDELEALS